MPLCAWLFAHIFFQVWDCRRRTCITTVTTGSRGVYGMAVVGNELVTSVGNSLCAWDLRQLSAGALGYGH
jgi:hypothetical protein